MSVDQYDLGTVSNRTSFIETVELKECDNVGRSLVAKKMIQAGDIVLIEHPLLQYLVHPGCRSSISPFVSHSAWKKLNDLVLDEEQRLGDHALDLIPKQFNPGVPAALFAYLNMAPPPSSAVRHTKKDTLPMLDFFYYPCELPQHPTVQLIRNVSAAAIKLLPDLFGHLEAEALASFVLKIYANAHIVSFEHKRTLPTHTRRRERREQYRSKWGEPAPSWPDDNDHTRTMVSLMSWGSKFAHACSPNLFLQYDPPSNTMVFTAVTTIQPGTVLTFSYLPEDDLSPGGLVCGITEMRKESLYWFKFFHCGCQRCTDLDWSRGVTCPQCHDDRLYQSLQQESSWTCQACGHHELNAVQQCAFIGDREDQVQRSTLQLARQVFGQAPLSSEVVGSIEPTATRLLDQQGSTPLPSRHWTYGYLHALLATYHLRLFPLTFGNGLADQLGMTASGLAEANVYLSFLDSSIWSHGNPMAAFFAGWRILSMVMDTTDRTRDTEKQVSQDSPLYKMAHLVSTAWLPLLYQVFSHRPSVVSQDMLPRLETWANHILTPP